MNRFSKLTSGIIISGLLFTTTFADLSTAQKITSDKLFTQIKTVLSKTAASDKKEIYNYLSDLFKNESNKIQLWAKTSTWISNNTDEKTIIDEASIKIKKDTFKT